MAAGSSSFLRDLGARLVTAVVAVPILLALAFWGPNYALWVLLAGAAAIGAHEYVRMTLGDATGPDRTVVVLGVFATLSAGYWSPHPIAVYATVSFTIIATLVLTLRTAADAMDKAAARIGHLLGGYAWMAALFGGLLIPCATDTPFATGPHQAAWLLFPMFTVWAGDTGAYFAGRAFGRTKLAPRVSPKKTREGAVGGLVASVGGAYLAWWLLPFPAGMEAWHVLAFAVPGAILGQVGDLCESVIKRSTGVKDSGTILYGHGGMLDRVDGLIFAAPWFATLKALLELP